MIECVPYQLRRYGLWPLRAAVLKTRLAACPAAARKDDVRPIQGGGSLRPAGVGLEDERRFCRYHRVFSRAVWSSLCTGLGVQPKRIISWFARRSGRWRARCTRGSSAPGLRDAKALVGEGDLAGCFGAFRLFSYSHAVCSPARDMDLERRATSRLVREGPSNRLLRRLSAGTRGIAGILDLLRVTPGGRHGKRITGIGGTPNWRSLPRSVNSQSPARQFGR